MGSSDVEAGFAKLQGEDFEYYMQTYSIILGRNSKKSSVDVDLSSLGGGMNISRHHARIFYDFHQRRFALEVLGKNGCFIEGILHLPGSPPVKLDSQDLLRIGDKEFYFLLPVWSILGGSIGARMSNQHHHGAQNQQHLGLPGSRGVGMVMGYSKKGRGREYYDDEFNEEEGNEIDGSVSGKRVRRGDEVDGSGGYVFGSDGSGSSEKAWIPGQFDKKIDGRSKVDREFDNQQLLQLEEKDVVSSVATVISDLCGPGEWMPVEKLHSELHKQYGNIWHHNRIRRYLTTEDYPVAAAQGKPWYGLLVLLKKYPEHFLINTKSKGHIKVEFVCLVSLT